MSDFKIKSNKLIIPVDLSSSSATNNVLSFGENSTDGYSGVIIAGGIGDPASSPYSGETLFNRAAPGSIFLRKDISGATSPLYVKGATAWQNLSLAGGGGGVGPQGATGPTGPAGANGNNGATGSQGPTGPQGPTGTIGPTGSIGPQGATGSIGPTGTIGPQGLAGTGMPSGVWGSVAYYGESGWVTLAAGTTGNVLSTQGSGANPIWTTQSGGSTGPSLPVGTGIVYMNGATSEVINTSYGVSITGASGSRQILGHSSATVSRSALSPVVWFKGGNYTLTNGQITTLTDLSGNGRDATKQAGAGDRTRAIRITSISGAQAFTLETPFATSSFAMPKMYTAFFVWRRKWSTDTGYHALWGAINTGTDGVAILYAGAASEDWQAGDLCVFGNGFTSGRAPRAISTGFPGFTDGEWVVSAVRVGTTPKILCNGYEQALRASTTSSEAGNNSSGALWIGSNPSTTDQMDRASALAELIIVSGEMSDAAMDSLHLDMYREYIGDM